MAHLTAGDIKPIYATNEATYGTAPGTLAYYGDVAEGGRITFTDTPTPHQAWRYGSRTFSPEDYVTTQSDNGFNASMEVRDVLGWRQVITNARPVFGSSLPSRSVFISTSDANERHLYCGCKTDSLTVSADAPGGIVKFEETVLAAYVRNDTAPTLGSADDTKAAVQWTGGVTLGGTTTYPQRFSLSIANNLERIRGPTLNNSAMGTTSTRELVEGRAEINFEMEVWMDDFNYIDASINNTAVANARLTLGITNTVTVTLSRLRYMGDGTHPDLKQDKMTQTLRFRADSITAV